MKSFRHQSIRKKLLITILSTIFISLSIASFSLVFYNYSVSKNEFEEQLNVLAELTAIRSTTALAFGDKQAVEANLNAFAFIKSIDLACMYDSKGKLFSEFYREQSGLICPDTWASSSKVDNGFVVHKRVSFKKRNLGHLVLQANAEQLIMRAWHFIYTTLIIMFVSGILAYLLSTRLQKSFTLPLIRLSNVARAIKKSSNFSLRAKVYYEDEVGEMAGSFNSLIHHVQEYQWQMQEAILELQDKTGQLASHAELIENRNTAVKNMFAGASHDLRQPLQAMSLFVNALHEVSNEEQVGLLEKLDLAIENMSTMFTDILDISKLESLIDNVQTEQVELRSLLDGIFHEFETLTQDKGLTLRFHLRDYLVISHPRMLERIIRNILSNAIRYTSQGGIILACRKRGSSVCIEVWDTGRGIKEEDLSLIFKNFYQVERTTTKGHQGFGLGLAIVKRLANMLAHPIEIYSRYQQGTLFRVIVPLKQSSPQSLLLPSLKNNNERIKECSEEGNKKCSEEGNKECVKENDKPTNIGHIFKNNTTRVLLIDDDDEVRGELVKLLDGWGMQVTSFASVKQMHDYLQYTTHYHFDVILSDYQLSDTETGLDVIALAREHIARKDNKQTEGDDEIEPRVIPALIITGTQSEVLLNTIKKSGICMLIKPVKPAKLRALLNYVLDP